MDVVVAVITYRRPEGLRRLLESLDGQELGRSDVRLRVLVVDNDVRESARAVCVDFMQRKQFSLAYFVEPTKGIPFARNRCIAEAGTDYDYLAFVDDDERVTPAWLRELLRVQEQFSADVTTGPVLPEFEEPPPGWVTRGHFYERRRRVTGEVCRVAFTHNVLFSREVLEAMPHRFDEGMANTGGSDGEFLRRVHRAGYKIVWADEALAYETIPTSRVSTRWLCQRMYRVGTTFSRERFRQHSWPVAVLLTGGAAATFSAYGAFVLPLAAFRGYASCVEGLRHVCYAGGLIAGAWGLRYEEYGAHHGK